MKARDRQPQISLKFKPACVQKKKNSEAYTRLTPSCQAVAKTIVTKCNKVYNNHYNCKSNALDFLILKLGRYHSCFIVTTLAKVMLLN